jgi:hypothetical protein
MSAIRAEMQLNATPFLASIARVQTSMRNLQASVAGITGAFFAVRSAMSGLSGVFNGMKGALDLGGKFSDMSAATGASVSELVMLTQAFQNNGMAAEAVGPMIARFQKALGGVNEEGQSTAGALEKLGINTLALSRMSVAQQFQELSRAFSAIENPAERTRRAMELFGRSGAQMITLFRDPEAFTRATAEIGSMGDVLEANASRFDSMSDAITTAGQKLDQFFVGMMSSFAGGGALEKAARTDFTPVGQSAGAVASALGEWLSPLQKLNDFMTTKVPYFTQIREAIEGAVSPRIADSAADAIGSQTESQIGAFDARVRSVASEDERAQLMEDLGTAIDAARARLENLDTEFSNLRPEDRTGPQNAIVAQLDLLERQRTVLASMTSETLDANAAEAQRAATLAKSAAEAAKLAAQLDKALEARDAEAEKRLLSQMSPEDAAARVLGQAGVAGDEGLASEIERLRAMGGDATDEEKARLMTLIEAEKSLLAIKERQTAEDEKRAEQAQRLSDLMGDLALEADKITAEAAGDTARVKELERQQAANTLAKRFEQDGMAPEDATKLAKAKAEADALREERQNAPQPRIQEGDAQRSIGLGGSAGLGASVDVQKDIAKKQADANRHLSKLVSLLEKRQPVMLAEVFD